MDKSTAAIALVLCTMIIFIERSLPWIIFGKREMPKIMKRLSQLLPSALMAILVVYSLKSLTTSDLHTVLSMSIASVFTVLFHLWKKNQILSVFLGTVVYMLILNLF